VGSGGGGKDGVRGRAGREKEESLKGVLGYGDGGKGRRSYSRSAQQKSWFSKTKAGGERGKAPLGRLLPDNNIGEESTNTTDESTTLYYCLLP